jgi:hypothetical protein
VETVFIDNSVVANSKKSKKNNTIFGLLGIIFGLIIVAIALFVLNYFKIINIFPASKLPLKNNIQKVVSISTPIKESKKLTYPKAQKAGYTVYWEVTWNNNAIDESGRYILASKERVVNGWIDQMGWQKQATASSTLSRATGIFWRWESIQGTKDKYIIIRDMLKNEEIKLRVLSSPPTVLNVNNLDYGPLNTSIIPMEKIGNFGEIADEKLDTIIKRGDIISGYIVAQGKNIEEDQAGAPVVTSVEMRRFGGLMAIKNELSNY